jgi:steroid delta-isomerase
LTFKPALVEVLARTCSNFGDWRSEPEETMAMPDDTCTARDLARRSQTAVKVKDREGWLSLFAPDAVVQDPIGPSPFDPDGAGHHGLAAIAAFYDTVIAPNELITFEIESSYLCGDEVADVGAIRTVLPGGKHVALVHGVYTYRGNGAGQLVALRAFWEFDKLELIDV